VLGLKWQLGAENAFLAYFSAFHVFYAISPIFIKIMIFNEMDEIPPISRPRLQP